MNHRTVILAPLLALLLASFSLAARESARPSVNWPSFRGPSASGIAEGYPTPTTWDIEKVYCVDKNTGDYLYVCRINGVLGCYEAKTGKCLYQERLGTGRTGFTASPVAADGKIYIASEDGDVYVIQAGPAFKLLSVNPMGEICMATPAISEGTLFFRTQGNLVAIAERAKP